MTMDIIHDYEYYEAHAKDVKIEDITSDEDNADILASLRDNDFEFNQISIVTTGIDWPDFVVREGDHLGWLGYFVGRSRQLDALYIDDLPENINPHAFLEGLGRNRSIKKLEFGIDLGESFQTLIPFLTNNDNVRHLSFNGIDIGLQCARNVALLLGQISSLKHLEFDGTNIDHEGLLQIIAALKKEPQIEALIFNDNVGVGRDGCVALGSMLEDWRSPNLKRLVLAISDIEEEGLSALAAGLRNCHNLTWLCLNGNEPITEAGSRSLSTLFQSGNCRLEHLDLGEMNIDEDGMAVLATGLASLPSLKWLKLWDTSIGEQGLQDLVGSLVNCNLEELRLSSNMLMDSVSGLRSLGTLVRKTTSMRVLNLCDSLTDEGLRSFVEGVANCCNLTVLRLSRNRSITANGLASLSSLFRTEYCSLRTLYLFNMNIGDDGAAALANGLVGNKSLEHLAINEVSDITARGWAAFSRLLCDTSSVNNTYLSNHTLVFLGGYGTQDIPQDILQYLKLNGSHNQAAAICKILQSHPDIDVTPLFEFNLKCLPLVVAWLEKAKSNLDKVNESSDVFQCRQLSAVYNFIRGMPLLAVNGHRSQKMEDVQSQPKSKKRKFDLSL